MALARLSGAPLGAVPATGIRTARAGDLDPIEALETRVFSGDRLSRRSIARFLKSPRAAFLVIEEEGALRGDALVVFRKGSRHARLYSLCVEPQASGRGLGQALLVACEERAAERGAATLHLEVRRDNAHAIRLYERAGYSFFGTIEDFYEDGETAMQFEKALGHAP